MSRENLGQAGAGGDRGGMVIKLCNWHALACSCGSGMPLAIQDAIGLRLACWGVNAAVRIDPHGYVFIRMDELARLAGMNPVDACAAVEAALMGEPIVDGGEAVALVARVSIGRWRDLELRRGRPSVSNPDLLAFCADMAVSMEMLEALAQGRLCLAFQSIHSHDPAEQQCEVLLRRTGEADGSPSSPSCASELRAMERVGLRFRLDYSILSCALGVLEAHPGIRLGCGVCGSSLADDAWWRLIRKGLAHAPGVAQRLTLEITETQRLGDDDEAFKLLEDLRQLGCRIGIEGFGAGMSTLAFAVRLRPDVIKLDRSWVAAARGDPARQAVLRELTALCLRLSPCVVAEGIENGQDFYNAARAGVTGTQGHPPFEEPSVEPHWLDAPVRVHDLLRQPASNWTGFPAPWESLAAADPDLARPACAR